MKKLIIVTLITTCAALCAAVWPHNNATEQTPVPAAETAVSAKEATVAEIEEPTALAEKEKGTIPRQEAPREEQPELEISNGSDIDNEASKKICKSSKLLIPIKFSLWN